jgi:PhnB protein
MKLATYLMFQGNCEEAFTTYQKVLGGKITAMMTHEGTPAESDVSPEWRKKIIHACLELDGQMLMASDAPPERSSGAMRGVYVNVMVTENEEAERIFKELSEGGQVLMPIAETFWAERFGMAIDRFGTHWMVNAEFKKG